VIAPIYTQPLDQLQATFLSAILPRVQEHARIQFRHLRCADKQADAIAEAVALSWSWFLRLCQLGKDVTCFVSTLATYAVHHVKCGRRLCGQERSKDVLSRLAQTKHDFTVERLANASYTAREHVYGDSHGQRNLDAFEERLHDNTITPVPDQVAFRQDFPAWQSTRTERDRRIIQDLMVGATTTDAARKYGVSPSRISQLRREFLADWQRFCDELPATACAPV
jgi:hypothetical protein